MFNVNRKVSCKTNMLNRNNPFIAFKAWYKIMELGPRLNHCIYTVMARPVITCEYMTVSIWYGNWMDLQIINLFRVGNLSQFHKSAGSQYRRLKIFIRSLEVVKCTIAYEKDKLKTKICLLHWWLFTFLTTSSKF